MAALDVERLSAPELGLYGALCARTSRPAIATLAASLLTSHSNGPGRVSSKSLQSKTRRRSGAAKTPKLERWASPQSWARRPVSGAAASSAAITAAPPRKKANAEVSMRP